MTMRNANFQLIWGIALLLAGIGVFFRIPQVMPRIEQIESFAAISGFIRFCFYLMGALLVGGGAQKIYRHFRTTDRPPSGH
jgi:hypothetical protein